jgi:predicted permease
MESAWVRIASSVRGFNHGPMEEITHAGSDAYPGAFQRRDFMLHKLFHRLRKHLQKEKAEREMNAEMRFHLEMETEKNIRRGMSEEAARLAAQSSFGGIERTKEAYRDLIRFRRLEEVWQDLRYGARMLLKKPGFTSIAVLTLALGIGANTAVFSVINSVLLGSLPFADADRLVMIWETHSEVHGPVGTYPDFQDWRAQAQSFQGMSAVSNKRFRNGRAELTAQGETVEVQGTLVSYDLFPLLGLKPILGRTFLSEEDRPAANRVVILSRALWQRRFANDRDVIGKSVQIDGVSFTVVGVMGEQYPLDTDFWVPLSHLSQRDLTNRMSHSVRVIGRLKHGVTIEEARREMEAIAARLQQLYPASNKNLGVELVPLHHQLVGNLRPLVLLVFAAVGLILLIACANVSNLLLANSAERQRELALRAALGARRDRLVRQLLTESLGLALLGGVAGLALASLSMPVLRSALLGVVTGKIPGLETIGIDWRVLGFTFGATLLTGILFGVLPALQISGIDLNQALKEGGKGSAGGRRNLSRTLVVAEVALTVIVLIGAGLLVRSFHKLLQVDPGFRADHLLSLQIELRHSRYQRREQIINFYQQLMARIRALPGVQQAALIDRLPMALSMAVLRFTPEGQQPEPGKLPITQMRAVDHRFFETMQIPLRSGRPFDESDVVKERNSLANDNEIIINGTMAQRFFPNQDPVGKRIFIRGPQEQQIVLLIIGVVADIKDLGVDAPVEPEIYFPGVGNEAVLLVRTAGSPLSLASAVSQAVLATDPALPARQAVSVEDNLAASFARRRFSLNLLGALALLALVLAGIGIYGVVAYSVTQRTQEIGIRLALGARASDVLTLVIIRGIGPALLGIVLGLAGAMALSRLVSTLTTDLLFEVHATDPVTFAAIALLLVAVALAACYLPARRATRVDPLVTLRHE